MTFTKYRMIADFKIKSKADVNTFINKVLCSENKYYIKFGNTLLTIDKNNDKITVCLRFGNLNNIFNPDIEIPAAENINCLYKYRKYINQYFFAE